MPQQLGKRRRIDSAPRELEPKRPRFYEPEESESDSDEDDESILAEPFDPDSFYQKAGKRLPEPIDKYVKKHFCSCIKDSHRKSMSKENTLPDSIALQCLKADDAVKDFMGKSFPKKLDDTYKRIQSLVNAAAAPVLGLWKDLEEQGFSGGNGSLMPVDSALEMIQWTLVLIGNASNYVSQCRRDNIIFKLRRQNPSLGTALSSICQEYQPDEKRLFGGGVQKALTERAESLAAMKKVSMKLDTSKTPPGRKDSQFFRRGPFPDHGWGAGRVYRPSNKRPHQKQQQRGFRKNPKQEPASTKKQ